MGRIFVQQLIAVTFAAFCLLPKSQAQADEAIFSAVFDTAGYDSLPLFADYTGRKGDGDDLKKVDLRPFCPSPGQQGASGSCAGFALGYGAMTVAWALENGVTDRDRIDQQRFSASFIYNQIKRQPTDCKEYSDIFDAMRLAKQKGNCPSVVFERLDDCSARPSAAQMALAEKYRIREAARIFDRYAVPQGKIDMIKNYLRDSTPIIVNFEVWRSFQELSSEKSFWVSPKNEQDDAYRGYHFMLVTGFDEATKTFDVLNSWGDRWGDHGFAQIDYRDMGRFCAGAYRVIYSEKWESRMAKNLVDLPEKVSHETPQKAPKSAVLAENGPKKEAPKPAAKPTQPLPRPAAEPIPIVGPTRTLRGSFDFLKVEKSGTRRSEAVVFDPEKKIYRPAAGSLALGSRFQLTTTDLPAGAFAYVFSCDPDGESKLHFPKTAAPRLSPSPNALVTIPSAQSVLALKKTGTDFLCILYANAPVPDIFERLSKLRNDGSSDVFLASFKYAFGDLTEKSAASATFQPNKMAVHANAASGQTIALPIILEVKTAQ